MDVLKRPLRLIYLTSITSFVFSLKLLFVLFFFFYSFHASAQNLGRSNITLCLDFNGHHIDRWLSRTDIEISAFNHHDDTDPTTLNVAEQSDMNRIINIVREDYSPFNITVISEPPTTSGVQGAQTAIGCSELPKGSGLRVVIGGHASDIVENIRDGFFIGGYAIPGSFTSTNPSVPNVALAFTNVFSTTTIEPAWYIGNTASHEAGHAFGLLHQAKYNGNQYLEELETGNDDVGPIMGGYNRTATHNAIINPKRKTWWHGPVSYLKDSDGSAVFPDLRSAFIQDDMKIIGSQNITDLPDVSRCIGVHIPANCVPKNPNGFGYRQDDHGDYAGQATRLFSKTINSIFESSGIIEKPSDIDYFSFVIPQGSQPVVSVTAQVVVHENITNLSPSVVIRDYTDSRNVPAASNQNTDTYNTELTPGEYYVRVNGQGNPGDTGQYTLKLAINSGLSIIHHQLFKDQLRVTFNERIDESTFSRQDILIKDGVNNSVPNSTFSIKKVHDATHTFDITFPKYTTENGIKISVGPRINNLRKQAMDQNGDGRKGTTSDIKTVVDISPPRVTSTMFRTDRINFQFDEGINPTTLNSQTVRLYNPVGSQIFFTNSIQNIDERNFYLPISSYPPGGITLVLGTGIKDYFGNPLASIQRFPHTDHNGARVIDSAYLEDEYLPGVGVVKQSAFLVAFDSIVTPDSLKSGGVSITYKPNPGTGIKVNNVIKVKLKDIVKYNSVGFQDSDSERLWLVNFDKIAYGTYELKVHQTVTDLFHNPLDQDNDGINGELQDVYTHQFEIRPRVNNESNSLSKAYILAGRDLWGDEWLLNHTPNMESPNHLDHLINTEKD